MRFRSVWVLILALFAFYHSSLKSTEAPFQRIYISAADLEITDHGIYLRCADAEHLRVDSVFSDDYGLYIELVGAKPSVATDECDNRHPIWCWRCNGCAFPYCKFRCRCVEWPFMAIQ